MGTRDDVGGLDRVAANERRFLALEPSRSTDTPVVLECECTHASCDLRVELTPAEYEPVRSSAARYVVGPDESHVHTSLDRVVERRPSYWVVERRPSVEVLDFEGARTRSITSELTARAHDTPAHRGRLRTLTEAPSEGEPDGPA